ncbi:hypothetical protein EC968_004782 [Mortierella alpina]|nr:hypothetical protein EC968_004782 [Mortierella alpina]
MHAPYPGGNLAANDPLIKASSNLAASVDISDPDLDIGHVVIGGMGAVAAVTSASLLAAKLVHIVVRDNGLAIPSTVAPEAGGLGAETEGYGGDDGKENLGSQHSFDS